VNIIINEEYRAQFLAAYMEAAEWSSLHTRNPDTPEEHTVEIDSLDLDWHPDAEAQAREWCNDFIAANMADLILADTQRNGARPDQNGHDLWLTANHHGAGFWDRGLGDVGKRLTDASRHFNADLEVGDDNFLHLLGESVRQYMVDGNGPLPRRNALLLFCAEPTRLDALQRGESTSLSFHTGAGNSVCTVLRTR
jgi:hypothetical protein